MSLVVFEKNEFDYKEERELRKKEEVEIIHETELDTKEWEVFSENKSDIMNLTGMVEYKSEFSFVFLVLMK